MANDQKPAITFWGGVGSVTGANFLFELAGSRLLVDCGLVQGTREAGAENRADFDYDPASIQYLFITHAHLDHVGRIPKLVKDGFKGTIYSTPETKALAALILEDAASLVSREAKSQGVLPMYEPYHVGEAMALWQEIPYHEKTSIGGAFDVYLRDAGHILGSAMFEFSHAGRKYIFTGDLGNSPTPLLKDTEDIGNPDYIVMESVYGDRNHEGPDERRDTLMRVINETTGRGGTLLIPAFSLERTQVILYEINRLVEEKKIPHVPVFIDSPLAIKVTDIYKRSKRFFNDTVQGHIKGGDDIFNFPNLSFTPTGDESRAISHRQGAKVIIAGSGMSVGGRVVYHEIEYLPDPKATILLVGYQSIGTVGRAIQDGSKKVVINGHDVSVKAHIEMINGYSSHKDSDHLLEFVDKAKGGLKAVFCVMGEPKASTFLVQKIRDFSGANAVYPERGIRYELD
jgi:metallo-beta-lactamase family protein